MMKKIIYPFISAAIILCYSCNDFLDVMPDNRTVLDNPEAVQELIVSAYPNMQYFHVCEVMSDNVGERKVSGGHSREILNDEMYRWLDGYQSGTGQDTPYRIWSGCYSAIAAANQALEVISEAVNPQKFTTQKGEALVCRALNHFMLVNIFSEHYDPATAGTQLGIPYNTEAEKVAVKYYKRNTVAEVYELIEKDLMEGIELIDDNVYNVPKYHFTKAAAHAFAARYYLYVGDWDKVLEHADAALGTNISGKLLPLDGPVFKAPVSSDDYEVRYRRVDQPDILLLVGCTSSWGRDHASTSLRYGMIAEHSTLFTSRNITGSSSLYYRRWSSSTSGGYLLHKYYDLFKLVAPGASTGNAYTIGAWFTIEDVLFMRAEAYVMKGKIEEALSDVNVFLSRRVNLAAAGKLPIDLAAVKTYYNGKSNYPELVPFYRSSIDDDQMSMLKCIVDWRRIEFMQEGLRWFDIKRFHLEVVHAFPNTGGDPVTLTANDLRRALQIPMEAQAYGVEPNPR
jgi:tetratricopeptide (TPR) repeat protein